jgi:hypothetical protein
MASLSAIKTITKRISPGGNTNPVFFYDNRILSQMFAPSFATYLPPGIYHLNPIL